MSSVQQIVRASSAMRRCHEANSLRAQESTW
jgi:hypothetical protein